MSDVNARSEGLGGDRSTAGVEPVRWGRGASLYRRRRRRNLLLALVLVILLASAVIAAKAVFDPSFDPPIFSRRATSVRFDEPTLGRGLTRLDDYSRAIGKGGEVPPRMGRKR